MKKRLTRTITRRRGLLTAFIALLVVALTLTAGSGVGVGQEAYLVDADTVTIDPPAACRGANITLSGGGLDQNMVVVLRMTAEGDREVALGSATADAAGNWSFATTVPLTQKSLKDGSDIPLDAGAWNVWAVATAASANVNFTAVGTLTVLECSGSLPATGAPLVTIACLLAALLSVAVIVRLTWRHMADKM